ncbi:MAG: hypothetical protein COX81_03630 [Candidatus Magasanikbacteria bacterium CG_4_10_14_0_2_um_filter_37_12]|uniref:Uncharacterized protein n=1 Tax=Candidatus Magasanikbacteria bacterium CG_4_10_14_0_2_um_filter_37_12 TaxID=1974637 RepID=A0A2M7V6W2_9BACT|nr:MAG: hypothetical protein COX81_03630 [Candidatus Magasanikbacteria bacterium CG_4_10_14_0_2_um_filter_37_12]
MGEFIRDQKILSASLEMKTGEDNEALDRRGELQSRPKESKTVEETATFFDTTPERIRDLTVLTVIPVTRDTANIEDAIMALGRYPRGLFFDFDNDRQKVECVPVKTIECLGLLKDRVAHNRADDKKLYDEMIEKFEDVEGRGLSERAVQRFLKQMHGAYRYGFLFLQSFYYQDGTFDQNTLEKIVNESRRFRPPPHAGWLTIAELAERSKIHHGKIEKLVASFEKIEDEPEDRFGRSNYTGQKVLVKFLSHTGSKNRNVIPYFYLSPDLVSYVENVIVEEKKNTMPSGWIPMYVLARKLHISGAMLKKEINIKLKGVGDLNVWYKKYIAPPATAPIFCCSPELTSRLRENLPVVEKLEVTPEDVEQWLTASDFVQACCDALQARGVQSSIRSVWRYCRKFSILIDIEMRESGKTVSTERLCQLKKPATLNRTLLHYRSTLIPEVVEQLILIIDNNQKIALANLKSKRVD